MPNLKDLVPEAASDAVARSLTLLAEIGALERDCRRRLRPAEAEPSKKAS